MMSGGRGLLPGTMVAAQWRIMRVLGQGGFGVTYEAQRAPDNAHVALKEYMPTGLCTRHPGSTRVTPFEGPMAEIFQQGLASFLREAATLARLDHPAIVRIREHFPANDTAYMALDFIEGGSVKHWLASLGRRPTQEEMDAILRPIIEALVDVHSLPLLHRDLKPDNIMLRADGSPVLIDFGAVKTLVSSATRTVGHGTLGFVTEGYAPPEQYVPDGERLLGPWTDVYALAATCYEAVSGAPPQPATLRLVEDGTLPLAAMASGGGWRPAFLAGVDQALALRRQDRPQSMIEFRQAIGLARVRDAGSAARTVPAPVPASPAPHAQGAPVSPLPPGAQAAYGGAPSPQPQAAPPPNAEWPQGPPPPQAPAPQSHGLPPFSASPIHPLSEPPPRRSSARQIGVLAAAIGGLAVISGGIWLAAQNARVREAQTIAAIENARTVDDLEAIARTASRTQAPLIDLRRRELLNQQILQGQREQADRMARLRADIARTTDPGTLDRIAAEEPALRGETEARKRAHAAATIQTGAAGIAPGSGRSFRDCAQCPEMVIVPPGSFVMGAPPDERERETDEQTVAVRFVRPFAIGRFEITFEEWEACHSEGGCLILPDDGAWGRGRRPVMNVSREDVLAYLAWLSRKSRQTYRLPSEAEWEYAARAGTMTRYGFGNAITTRDANFDGRSDAGQQNIALYRQQTVEVGSYRANAWGLHDTHGNVAEWTDDCYVADNSDRPRDGTAASLPAVNCQTRVTRGGAWFHLPSVLRSANRMFSPPSNRNTFVGFRVVRDVR